MSEHIEEFAGFAEELAEESDRGCVVLAGAYLDALLEALLTAAGVTEDLSVYARINRAKALRQIDDRSQQRLHLIRGVRNHFAHRVRITFQSPGVADEVRALWEEHDDNSFNARQSFIAASWQEALSLCRALANRGASGPA